MCSRCAMASSLHPPQWARTTALPLAKGPYFVTPREPREPQAPTLAAGWRRSGVGSGGDGAGIGWERFGVVQFRRRLAAAAIAVTASAGVAPDLRRNGNGPIRHCDAQRRAMANPISAALKLFSSAALPPLLAGVNLARQPSRHD